MNRKDLTLAASITLVVGAEIYRAFRSYIETQKALAEIKRLALENDELKAKAAERNVRTPTDEEIWAIGSRQNELIRRAKQESGVRYFQEPMRLTIVGRILFVWPVSIYFLWLLIRFLWWVVEKVILIVGAK
jgi:Flp pilus assembly protein TadB